MAQKLESHTKRVRVERSAITIHTHVAICTTRKLLTSCLSVSTVIKPAYIGVLALNKLYLVLEAP